MRYEISRQMLIDVVLDGTIDLQDLAAVVHDPAYISRAFCSVNCGRADVNRDGYVTSADVLAISQSVHLGQDVQCGAVYATDFSCGSTNDAPETEVFGLSLDMIEYFAADGRLESRRRSSEAWVSLTGTQLVDSVLSSIRVELRDLENRTRCELEQLKQTDATAHAKLARDDGRLAAQLKAQQMAVLRVAAELESSKERGGRRQEVLSSSAVSRAAHDELRTAHERLEWFVALTGIALCTLVVGLVLMLARAQRRP